MPFVSYKVLPESHVNAEYLPVGAFTDCVNVLEISLQLQNV